MDSLEPVNRLKRAGRFSDALATLESTVVPQAMRLDSQVLKLELLERLRQHVQCGTLASLLVKSTALSPGQRSACEYVRGRIAFEKGDGSRDCSTTSRGVACN